MPRSLRWLLGVAVVAAAGTFTAGPYVGAAAFIARAADLAGPPATLAAWTASPVTAPMDATVPTRYGDVPGRVYRPANGFTRTIVLVPGVHRDGIDEARLVGLAQDLAATGYGVLTVAAPDLQRYRITPLVTDVIEDAVRWASEQRELAPDGRVGVLGVSFSGGLSIVAAGRDRIRDRVAFLLSFGGHGNLARVMHYLCSGEVVGDLASARASRVVTGAETRGGPPAARLRRGGRPPHARRAAGPARTGRDRSWPASRGSCWPPRSTWWTSHAPPPSSRACAPMPRRWPSRRAR